MPAERFELLPACDIPCRDKLLLQKIYEARKLFAVAAKQLFEHRRTHFAQRRVEGHLLRREKLLDLLLLAFYSSLLNFIPATRILGLVPAPHSNRTSGDRLRQIGHDQ